MEEKQTLTDEKTNQKNNVSDLKIDMEVYEITTSTVLDTLGASLGKNSCSSVIITTS